MPKQNILNKFPKVQPTLPEKFQKIYTEHYKSNREGASSASLLAQKMEAWMHKKVAKDLTGDNKSIETLEIGSGTLNQLPYEYATQYDIIEPFTELFENSADLYKVRNIFKDISEIENNKYNRITSIAVFEHIIDLPYVVAKSCLLLKKSGSLRIAIPNEGTILWRLGWMLTTGLEFKLKYNLNYSTLLKHEHVNNAKEVEQVLKYFFSSVKRSVYGVHKSLGLYRFYECKEPIFELAEEYINKMEHRIDI